MEKDQLVNDSGSVLSKLPYIIGSIPSNKTTLADIVRTPMVENSKKRVLQIIRNYGKLLN